MGQIWVRQQIGSWSDLSLHCLFFLKHVSSSSNKSFALQTPTSPLYDKWCIVFLVMGVLNLFFYRNDLESNIKRCQQPQHIGYLNLRPSPNSHGPIFFLYKKLIICSIFYLFSFVLAFKFCTRWKNLPVHIIGVNCIICFLNSPRCCCPSFLIWQTW